MAFVSSAFREENNPVKGRARSLILLVIEITVITKYLADAEAGEFCRAGQTG
jgi:hypothetical protein